MVASAISNPQTTGALVLGTWNPVDGAFRTVKTGLSWENDPGFDTPPGSWMSFSVAPAGPFIMNQSLYSPVSMADAPSSITVMLGEGLVLSGSVTSAGPVRFPAPGGMSLFVSATVGVLLLRHTRGTWLRRTVDHAPNRS